MINERILNYLFKLTYDPIKIQNMWYNAKLTQFFLNNQS